MRSTWFRPGAFLGILAILSCSPGDTTSPTPSGAPAAGLRIRRTDDRRAEKLTLGPENAQVCATSRRVVVNGETRYKKERVVLGRGLSVSERVRNTPRLSGAQLGRAYLIAWGPDGRLEAEVSCVVPQTEAATASVKAAMHNLLDSAAPPPSRGGTRANLDWEQGTTVWCSWVSYDRIMTCEGVECTSNAINDNRKVRRDPGIRASRSIGGLLDETYVCDNDCEIYEFENGSMDFWCSNWGENPEDLGNGGGSGTPPRLTLAATPTSVAWGSNASFVASGGTISVLSWDWTSTQPNDSLTSAASCPMNTTCTIPIYGNGEMTIVGVLAGDTTSSHVSISVTAPPCEAQKPAAGASDSLCFKAFTDEQRDSVMKWINAKRANTANIADEATRAWCERAWELLDGAFQMGQVGMGQYSTSLSDPRAHWAAIDKAGFIHIDPVRFQDASLNTPGANALRYKEEVVLSLLHEGLHRGTYPPHGDTPPYTNTPWSFFNGATDYGFQSPGSWSKCVNW